MTRDWWPYDHAGRCGARGRVLRVLLRFSLLVAMIGGVVGALSSAASANAPGPATVGGSEVVNSANGNVTISVNGTWTWQYASLHAKTKKPCDSRIGVGWAIQWADPDDAGYPVSYPKFGYKTHMGTTGGDGLNAAEQVQWNPAAPCGTFVLTNNPMKGAGYATGTWSGTHTYKDAGAVPPTICAIMFDLAFKPGPKASRLLVTNRDSTIHNELKATGTYQPSMGGSCLSTSSFVVTTSATKPIPTTTPPPPPAPTVPPVAAPAGSLAATGVGRGVTTLAWLGLALASGGALVLLFGFRWRRLFFWLTGCS